MQKVINEFKGQYSFLSNFYESMVTVWGITFQNSEAAFQSAKIREIERRKSFAHLNPSAAKSKGRRVPLRADWDSIKDEIMYEVVFAKFAQNEDLKRKLIETGDAELIEGNYWNDTYWGVCNGRGKNKLGKILMKVRTELLKTK